MSIRHKDGKEAAVYIQLKSSFLSFVLGKWSLTFTGTKECTIKRKALSKIQFLFLFFIIFGAVKINSK